MEPMRRCAWSEILGGVIFPAPRPFLGGVPASTSYLRGVPAPPGTMNPKILGGPKKVHFYKQMFEFMLRKEKNFCARSAQKIFLPPTEREIKFFSARKAREKILLGVPKIAISSLDLTKKAKKGVSPIFGSRGGDQISFLGGDPAASHF